MTPDLIDKCEQGVTPSERYLAGLCKRTFLSLWSYPNTHREQGDLRREICDLLVVCGNDVIIFSDKDCQYKWTGNLNVDWQRWYRGAISASVKQVYGAERWLKNNPKNVYIDRKCKKPLPIALPSLEEMRVHRVVVSSGCKTACKRHFESGSGSLIVTTDPLVDENGNERTPRPFNMGLVGGEENFVHVFDEVALDIILRELNTITDFLRYLQKRKQLFFSKLFVVATGEEDLLGRYLIQTDIHNDHWWQEADNYDGYSVEEGSWEHVQDNPQYIARKKADQPSYLWDQMIETVINDTQKGTLLVRGDTDLERNERLLRIMASEPRLARRVYSLSLLQFIETSSSRKRNARVTKSAKFTQRAYVFVALARKEGISEEEYRSVRYYLLYAYCLVLGERNRELSEIVGIATEPGSDNGGRSYDFAALVVDEWTKDLILEASKIQKEFGILSQEILPWQHEHIQEYPDSTTDIYGTSLKKIHRTQAGNVQLIKKGRMKIGRNDLCPCGSHRKYKKCCGKKF